MAGTSLGQLLSGLSLRVWTTPCCRHRYTQVRAASEFGIYIIKYLVCFKNIQALSWIDPLMISSQPLFSPYVAAQFPALLTVIFK